VRLTGFKLSLKRLSSAGESTVKLMQKNGNNQVGSVSLVIMLSLLLNSAGSDSDLAVAPSNLYL
jgi:hypothetical protein